MVRPSPLLTEAMIEIIRQKKEEAFIERALACHPDYGLENYAAVRFEGALIKVEIICPLCEAIYSQLPHNHLKPQGCPFCNQKAGGLKRRKPKKKRERKPRDVSRGHALVREALQALGFVLEKDFFEEVKFEGCHYIDDLPFDFYIPSHHCLIEYQGKQHYRFVKHFHKDQRGFELRQLKDQIKLDYAQAHGYLLLKIPYTIDRLDLITKGLIERLNL